MSLISVIMNLQNRAVTQYANFDFNSFCKIGDTLFAASDSGLFSLEGDLDNGLPIDGEFELVTSDFGIANLKRLRSVYVGGRADGETVLTVKDDEGNAREYSISLFKTDKQTGVKASIGRNGLGRYWSIGVKNVGGSYFSVDGVEIVPIVLGKKPRKIGDATARAAALLPRLTTVISE
jgi:hypothetical protein